jgi:hypothetical protein
MTTAVSSFLATYRTGFYPAFSLQGLPLLSSDSGWGCSIRSIQTLLLNATRTACPSLDAITLCSSFDDSSGCFGLRSLLNGDVEARWRGPHEVCLLIARRSTPHDSSQLSPLIQSDGTISLNEVTNSLKIGRPTLILLPLRMSPNNTLGVAAGREFLALLSLSCCVGAITGPTGHCLCILPTPDGFTALDPHRVQSLSESPQELASSLLALPDDVREIEVSDLDSSCAFGFLIRNAAEYDDFCQKGAIASSSLAFVISRELGESPHDDNLSPRSDEDGEGWIDASVPIPTILPLPSPPSLRLRVWRWMLSLARALRGLRQI